MVKAPYVDNDGLKKGAWSQEEDEKLRAYIVKYGHWNWRLLPKFAGLQRCGKSCRLRWMNYLKAGVKRGEYSEHEKDLIAKLHQQLGNKWSAIAGKLPGRTDNDIKNYWHTHLQKGEKRHSKSVQGAENISWKKQSSQRRNCRINLEQVSAGSDVTCVDPNLCKRHTSEVYSHMFILESSSSNSMVSSTAFEWDMNFSVAQNDLLEKSRYE